MSVATRFDAVDEELRRTNPCTVCGGSCVEEVYAGHGNINELPCTHCGETGVEPLELTQEMAYRLPENHCGLPTLVGILLLGIGALVLGLILIGTGVL